MNRQVPSPGTFWMSVAARTHGTGAVLSDAGGLEKEAAGLAVSEVLLLLLLELLLLSDLWLFRP